MFNDNPKQIGLLAVLLTVVILSFPYLLLRNMTAYWANYLFWTILTLLVMIWGYLRLKEWGAS